MRTAAARLGAEHERCASSRLYLTEPLGPPQPRFLNAALAIETERSPEALLALLLAIERDLGRVRDERWGPRTIDLDLLVYDEVSMQTPDLTLPHPRLTERAFALAPLLDAAPDLVPRYGAALEALGGAPPMRAWTRVRWIDGAAQVEALDLADALALAVTGHLAGGPATIAVPVQAPDPHHWITVATSIPGARRAVVERCDSTEVRGIVLTDGGAERRPGLLGGTCAQVVVIAGPTKVG